MAWMSDEEYLFKQDSKEKKITARSARHARSHCGKSGSVKFPSDFLTKKEKEAMNGECKAYHLNDPMTWSEFKELPDDLKVAYVKSLREKFNVPDKKVAEMMGVHYTTFGQYIRCLGLGKGKKNNGGYRSWYRSKQHEEFVAWLNSVKIDDISEEEIDECCVDELDEEDADVLFVQEDEAEAPEYIPYEDWINNKGLKEPTKETPEISHVIEDDTCEEKTTTIAPKHGQMTFEGNIHDILKSIESLLADQNVCLNVDFEIL